MSNTDSFSDRLSAARMKHLNEQQNVSKHFLRTNLAPGRLALGATIVAGGASTLAFTLQSFAFAHSVSLIVIERAAFKQVISWMLVFGAAIELRNVTVHYTGRTHPALSNISLRIDAGQKVAITGP